MLKKIEKWLRRIFSDEANQVEKTLRAYFICELKRIDVSFAVEREKYIAQIRDTLTTDLKQFRADLVAEKVLAAVPQHWKADEETLKSDLDLRHPKPARR